MLGLVAMATTVDSLYAAMKAMVCIVGNNPQALKEMERTGGFQVQLYMYTRIVLYMYTCIPYTSAYMYMY